MEIQKFTKSVYLRDKDNGHVYSYSLGTEKNDIYDMVVSVIVRTPCSYFKKSHLVICANEPYDETKVSDFIDRVNKALEDK